MRRGFALCGVLLAGCRDAGAMDGGVLSEPRCADLTGEVGTLPFAALSDDEICSVIFAALGDDIDGPPRPWAPQIRPMTDQVLANPAGWRFVMMTVEGDAVDLVD